MTLRVQTARITYRGPNRLDVTRKSGTDGLFLAPSWAILRPALDARREVERLQREGADVRAADVERSLWADYVPAYFDEMRRSYVDNRVAWTDLLARERVVLCCYCTDPEHCHRALLRKRILPALGAIDEGEIK